MNEIENAPPEQPEKKKRLTMCRIVDYISVWLLGAITGAVLFGVEVSSVFGFAAIALYVIISSRSKKHGKPPK